MRDPGFHISKIIDLETLHELFQQLSSLIGIATAVLDLDGNVLIATNWQNICKNFHRMHPETATRCTQSDTVLASQLEAGHDYNIYLCQNGLVDVAVPIVVNDVLVGNLFTGQFFFQPPDYEYFERQAAEFEFDREAYLDALTTVPVFSREYVAEVVSLLGKIAQVIGLMGLAKMKLEEKNVELFTANTKLQEYQNHLKTLIEERTTELDKTKQLLLDDIRQREQVEMSLDYLSNFDRRTNLPNHFKFEEDLFELLNVADSQNSAVAVTTVELRNYKQIINNFDHPVGDRLLRKIAERIVLMTESSDIVARMGEDSLLFSYSSKDVEYFSGTFFKKNLDAFSKPLILEGHQIFPILCMGTALYPADASNAKDLVQKAVAALTYCVDQKSNGIAMYCNSTQEQMRKKLALEKGLREALKLNNFCLYLQPQVDQSGKTIGAETLLRWKREDNETVSPAEFIPIAEECGLILSIGEWVLRESARCAIQLKETFGYIVPVGVNVSAKQFQDEAFVDIVDRLLLMDGMTSDMLEIEITESTFIDNIDKTIETLTDLKVRGLRIAIDDFGTGYSSLSYLSKFPVDRLKIDRSFVANIEHNESDRTLVSLVVEMGRRLGLNVIAEGIENEIQKNLLIGMGCHALQGFYFGKPMCFDEFCTHTKSKRGQENVLR